MTIYKIKLIMNSTSSTPYCYIFVATNNSENISKLIEKNKMWFEKDGKYITYWSIVEQNDSPKYEDVVYCDIVDDEFNDDDYLLSNK